MQVRADPAGNILLSVPYQGAAVGAEVSLQLLSAFELRRLGGSLQKSRSQAVALIDAIEARPRLSSPGIISFAVPVPGKIPGDGVVVADVALHDAFGRVLHTSVMQFTSTSTFDTLLGISVAPTSVLLSAGYGQRVPLRVTGNFAIAGPVDLSGVGQRVSYSSADPAIAATNSLGEVIARRNGETDVTVTYASYSAVVHVVSDSTATLDHLEIGPVGAQIHRVRGSLQLQLTGVLSSAARADPPAGSSPEESTPGLKRGPSTDPNAPHNRTIREQAQRLEDEGNRIIAGGGKERKPEKLIPTLAAAARHALRTAGLREPMHR